jgi:hypothetical protein
LEGIAIGIGEEAVSESSQVEEGKMKEGTGSGKAAVMVSGSNLEHIFQSISSSPLLSCPLLLSSSLPSSSLPHAVLVVPDLHGNPSTAKDARDG